MNIATRVKVLGLALILSTAYCQSCLAQDSTGFAINFKSETFVRKVKNGVVDGLDLNNKRIAVIPSIGFRFSPHHQLNLGFFAFRSHLVIEDENKRLFIDQESYGVSFEYQGTIPIWKRINLHYSLDVRNHWGLDTTALYDKIGQYSTREELRRVTTGEMVGQVGVNLALGKSMQHRIIIGMPILMASYIETVRRPGARNIISEEMQFSSFSSPTLIIGYQFLLK